MNVEWATFLVGALALVGSVVVTMIGVSWRLRGLIFSAVDNAMQAHIAAEHTRDSEGRTLRERIGQLEVRCRERHGG